MPPGWENVDQGISAIKVFGVAAASFAIAMFLTPLLTHYLYRYRLWRKDVRQKSPDGSKTPFFAKLHAARETRVPRMGGILIWSTTLFLSLLLWVLAGLTGSPFWEKANFLSRNQTWLPLFVMVSSSLLGLADDVVQVFGKGGYVAGGIRFRYRLLTVFLIGLASAWWFYAKLDWRTIYIPGWGDVWINGLYIPLFTAVMILLFSSSVIDGIDGLAGGVFGAIFASYGIIAFFRGQIDLAAFAAAILGSLLAFLWFNIPPARFYMGESGIVGLTTSLTVIAFLTDSVFVLPLIGILLFVEVASVVIQFASKRWRGKKVFLIAPIHHHFEARGWPPEKVTMRFWVIGVVAAIGGTAVALIGR
jgi:phospho-N-acetylmuramoyl-pentapeptide-transferase